MEIKAILEKPYTEKQRINFVVQQNHERGCLIEETDTQLLALGFTEDEKAELERERLDKLSLTKREVFLALYNDKGITPDTLKSQITDPAALIEFEYANDYYRGNPLVTLIGEQAGYTPNELDYLFEHGEFEVKEADKQESEEENDNIIE